MPNQTARQQARRSALDAQSRMRQQRAEQERRRSALALSVVTALAERDVHVRTCEARAGEALRTLTDEEGLSLREAVEWCGGDEQLTVREATRLRKVEPAPSPVLDGDDGDHGPDADGDDAAVDGAVSDDAAVLAGSLADVRG